MPDARRTIVIELTNGRNISFPADRFKILATTTDEQLKEVTIRLNGYALRWENLDEDITIKGNIAENFQLLLLEQRCFIRGARVCKGGL